MYLFIESCELLAVNKIQKKIKAISSFSQQYLKVVCRLERLCVGVIGFVFDFFKLNF